MLRRMILSALFLCFLVVWATPVQADLIVDFEVYKVSDAGGGHRYFAGIGVGRRDFTSVQWWDGSAWKNFQDDIEPDEDWFDLETDDYSSLSDLNSAIGGARKMMVHTATGYATYTFTVNEVTEGMFPIVPAITPSPFPASVSQNYTFTWTWDGNTADVNELCVEAGINTGSEWVCYEAESWDGEIDKTALSWTPNFSETGTAGFLVGYENDLAPGTLVTDWMYDSGDSTIADVFNFAGSDEMGEFASSGDKVEGFNVVPEPATLSLLVLGGLALIRRRRK